MTPARPRIYPRVFLAFSLGGLIWLTFGPAAPRWNGSDFVGFWVPAHLAAQGHATTIYDQAQLATLERTVNNGNERYLPWVYPPTLLLFILPLGLLPYMVAFVVWVTTGIAVYWAALRGLAGRDGAMLAFAYPGLFICISNGHAEFLLAGLFGAAMLLLDRKPVIAGVLIGLCTVKPHLFLLLPIAMAAGGHWRAIAAATVSASLIGIISLFVFGSEVWRGFLLIVAGLRDDAVSPAAAVAAVLAKQQSVLAFVYRFGDPKLATVLQLVTIMLAAWAVALSWANHRSPGERAFVLTCGTLLASPYLFDYDLVLLAVPMALVAREGLAMGFRPWVKTLLGLWWVAPLIVRGCAYYVALPVTVVLLGLSVMIFKNRLDNQPVPTA